MQYKLMHKGRTLHTADTEAECSEQATAWLAILDLFSVVGIELIVWKEWATGKRQRVRAFYTRGHNVEENDDE